MAKANTNHANQMLVANTYKGWLPLTDEFDKILEEGSTEELLDYIAHNRQSFYINTCDKAYGITGYFSQFTVSSEWTKVPYSFAFPTWNLSTIVPNFGYSEYFNHYNPFDMERGVTAEMGAVTAPEDNYAHQLTEDELVDGCIRWDPERLDQLIEEAVGKVVDKVFDPDIEARKMEKVHSPDWWFISGNDFASRSVVPDKSQGLFRLDPCKFANQQKPVYMLPTEVYITNGQSIVSLTDAIDLVNGTNFSIYINHDEKKWSIKYGKTPDFMLVDTYWHAVLYIFDVCNLNQMKKAQNNESK